MPRLRALMSWADRKSGEEFDATDDEARILTTPDLPGGQRAEHVRDPEARVMTTTTEPALVPQRGRYNRRDLRARE